MNPVDAGLPPPEPPPRAWEDSVPGLWRGDEHGELLNMKPRLLSEWMRTYLRRRRWIEDEWRRISDAIYAEEAARQEADGRNATPASEPGKPADIEA